MSGTANSLLGYDLSPQEQQVNRLFQLVMSNPVGTETISQQATSAEGQPFQPVAFWGGRPVSRGFRDMVDLGTNTVLGFAGTFGGENAATANRAMLARAKDMQNKGFGRDDILSETGWFFGPDNRWRFEINDQGMKLNPVTGDTTLGAAVEHPELFKAYPQLSETVLRTEEGRGGRFVRGDPLSGEPHEIVLGRSGKPEDTLLHEMQHNVQQIEGFAKGGSPNMAAQDPAFNKLLQERVKNTTTPLTYDAYVDAAWGGERSAASRRDYYTNYLKTVPKPADLYGTKLYNEMQWDIAREVYKRQFGEVEARSVPERRSMSPEARTGVGPWWPGGGWDVPEQQFLVRGQRK